MALHARTVLTYSVVGLCSMVSSTSQASFLGLCFVLDEARTAAAQSTAATGNDVYLLYAGFDNPGDFLTGIVDVNFDVGATLYQDSFGDNLPPNDAFFGLVPSLEFDSFITIGALTANAANGGVGLDGNGVTFTATGITGNSGWFSVPDTGLGTPVFNADLDGIHTVVLAQITIAQGPGGTVFTGSYSVGWNNAAGQSIITDSSEVFGFGWIPSPGTAGALLGGLALTSRRKRL